MSRETGAANQGEAAGESFLRRFHRRKTEARQREVEVDLPERENPPPANVVADNGAGEDRLPSAPAALTDADMPPLDTLTADSDYTGFLSEQVSETLRKAALRKLFHSTTFNITDGLDEYAEDFTTFETLGNVITADMRHMFEVEARKKAEAAQQAVLFDETEEASEPEDCVALPEKDEAAEQAPTLLTKSETLSPEKNPEPVGDTLSRTSES